MDEDEVQEIADEIVMSLCEAGEIDFGDLNTEKQCGIIEIACEEYCDRTADQAELRREMVLEQHVEEQMEMAKEKRGAF